MKKTVLILGAIAAVSLSAGRASADISLQSELFNLNGTIYNNPFDPSNPQTVPGLMTNSFDKTTGVGTLTLVYNPGAPGPYFFDVFFDHQLASPFWNEYGDVNGTAAIGQTWQIDVPDYQAGFLLNRTGDIKANAQGNTLDSTKHVPGKTDNFNLDCGADGGGPVDANCDSDVSTAMGFAFDLNAGFEEVITLNLLTTPPPNGVFYLHQVHPADAGNTGAVDLFFSGNATRQQIPVSAVPEPTSVVLLASVAFVALVGLRRRS